MSQRRLRKKRLIYGTVGALFAASLIAGCSTNAGADRKLGQVGQFEGRGPITYVQGKDNAGLLNGILQKWNDAHPGEEVTMIELSPEADEQRAAMVRNAEIKSDVYCVLSVDNVNVAEFAARGYIDRLPDEEFNKDEFLAANWETGIYRDGLYAIPHASDGPLLFYRKDILAEAGITEAPKSWEQMVSDWEAVKQLPKYEDIGGYTTQFAKYEGLTVTLTEAIHTFGGQIVDQDDKPAVDTPEARAGIQHLVDGFESGFIPRAALTHREEESRAAFEAGQVIFLKNWPYVYASSSETLGENLGVTNLPTVDGHEWAAGLGGHNVGISSHCKNKATALDFVKWYVSEEVEREVLEKETLAPVLTRLYDDPQLIEEYPYLPLLKNTIEQATPRPRAVRYGDVSSHLQDAAFDALQQKISVDQAVKQMQASLEEDTKIG